MTTTTLERGRGFGSLRKALSGAVAVGVSAARLATGVLRSRTSPTLGHVRDHGYTIVGFSCWDAAWFTHSTFSGLLWTAVSFIVFEWKVSD